MTTDRRVTAAPAYPDPHDDAAHGGPHGNGGEGPYAAGASWQPLSGSLWIDAMLLGGARWNGPTVTYSFPDSPADYESAYSGNNEPRYGFSQVSAAQMAATRQILEGTGGPRFTAVEAFLALDFADSGFGGADLRMAATTFPNGTAAAWAYGPSSRPTGGDLWFRYGVVNGRNYDFRNPQLGNFDHFIIMHELGHSLGLRDVSTTPGSGIPGLPSYWDSIEFTVMSYLSRVGGTNYGAETFGYPQSYMMLDIAALQHLYGANYATNAGDTVYRWTPSSGETFINGVGQGAPGANRIFLTIWDGGGNDTYDFSAYGASYDLTIDLAPGQWTDVDAGGTRQAAHLGDGVHARGQVANALLHQNNPASLIENAIGGAGNDIVRGNQANNRLEGRAGNDTLAGWGGNDTLDGGAGFDTAVLDHPLHTYRFTGPIGSITATSNGEADLCISVERYVFADGTFDATELFSAATIEAAGNRLLAFGGTHYFMRDGGGAGPVLRINGELVKAGLTAPGWTPLGTEASGGGYLVAWRETITGQYCIWTTDVAGAFTSLALDRSGGNTAALQSFETVFQQDLNGDGTLGVVTRVIESAGGTALSAYGDAFVLGAGGPYLRFDGSIVTEGRFGPAWAPLGAEASGGGYLVAWKNSAANQYIVWTTDAAGAFTRSATDLVGPGDLGLQGFETLFQQDLNGDGRLGLPTRVIESAGGTTLSAYGNVYTLAGGGGPYLRFDGSLVTEGRFGPWAPLGAEASGGGYLVAWKNSATNAYVVWTTDAAGGFTGLATGLVRGDDWSLQSLEASFQQDLNGDGTLGVVLRGIESAGATSLAGYGNAYRIGGGNGPLLSFTGAVVTEGQFGLGWAPIGAEASGGGYLVAWKYSAINQYAVWTTDAAGAFTGIATGPVGPGDSVLQRLETLFHQDLNGDGRLGLPTRVIESAGGTPLSAYGDAYTLAGSGGPYLRYDGSIVTEGRFGSWAPLGAEASGGGYLVAWKNSATNEYVVWTTDAGGSFTGIATATVGPGDPGLRGFEPLFQQDLNGDGILGL